METWQVVIILAAIFTMLLILLSSGIVLVAQKRITNRDKVIKQLSQENAHKQQLLDAYGIKEITIGGDEDE